MIKKPKVFIMCPGLGHINRGYETFTRECYDTLSGSPEIDLTLFKGAGTSSKKEIAIWCLQRNKPTAKFLAKLFKKDGYYFEQMSFLFSLIPYLLFRKATIIYTNDFLLGAWLHHLRRFLGFKYKLLFSNGAPNGPPFHMFDLVHQHLPVHLENATSHGEPPEKHLLLFPGINTSSLPKNKEKLNDYKQKWNIPLNKTVILAVGAINSSHKRMDYLISEVFTLNNPDLFVLIAGQKDNESDAIIKKGKELLKNNIAFVTVKKEEMPELYTIGDLFVLPSLTEGLPRVLLEAMDYGLPVLVNDSRLNTETLDSWGYYANFSKKGELSNLIRNVLSTNFKSLEKERHHYIYENFSWEKLKARYVKMILSLVK